MGLLCVFVEPAWFATLCLLYFCKVCLFVYLVLCQFRLLLPVLLTVWFALFAMYIRMFPLLLLFSDWVVFGVVFAACVWFVC